MRESVRWRVCDTCVHAVSGLALVSAFACLWVHKDSSRAMDSSMEDRGPHAKSVLTLAHLHRALQLGYKPGGVPCRPAREGRLLKHQDAEGAGGGAGEMISCREALSVERGV